MGFLDLARLRDSPLNRDPFEFVVVSFLGIETLPALIESVSGHRRARQLPAAGARRHPPLFEQLAQENSKAMRCARRSNKFSIDLENRPTMITLRMQHDGKDGGIHTVGDHPATVLVYMNPAWEAGRARLRSTCARPSGQADYVAEIPPLAGTMVAFRRSVSFHGHHAHVGRRRSIQLNWVTDAGVVRREIGRHRWSARLKALNPLRRQSSSRWQIGSWSVTYMAIFARFLERDERANSVEAVARLGRGGYGRRGARLRLVSGSALAQSPPLTWGFQPLPKTAAPGQIVDEVKAGLLGHDVGFLGDNIEHGPDVNLEMLFTSPDLLAVIGSPRPHIGADINTAGETSDAYAGLTWGISVIQNLFRADDYVFANGSLGAAYQDGFIDSGPPGRAKTGLAGAVPRKRRDRLSVYADDQHLGDPGPYLQRQSRTACNVQGLPARAGGSVSNSDKSRVMR